MRAPLPNATLCASNMPYAIRAELHFHTWGSMGAPRAALGHPYACSCHASQQVLSHACPRGVGDFPISSRMVSQEPWHGPMNSMPVLPHAIQCVYTLTPKTRDPPRATLEPPPCMPCATSPPFMVGGRGLCDPEQTSASLVPTRDNRFLEFSNVVPRYALPLHA